MGVMEHCDAVGELDHNDDDERTRSTQAQSSSLYNIYHSIQGPVSEPTLKPTKIKPLPNWMSLLPSNIHQDRRQRRQVKSSEPCPSYHKLESLNGRGRSVFECYFYGSIIDNSSTCPPTEPPTGLPSSWRTPTSASMEIKDPPKAVHTGSVSIPVYTNGEYLPLEIDHRESLYFAVPGYTQHPGRQETLLPPQAIPYPSTPQSTPSSHSSRDSSAYHVLDFNENPSRHGPKNLPISYHPLPVSITKISHPITFHHMEPSDQPST